MCLETNRMSQESSTVAVCVMCQQKLEKRKRVRKREKTQPYNECSRVNLMLQG